MESWPGEGRGKGAMKRPNIVMILIDDLGARDLACFGSTFYETPNLDRLAREGMRFENAYASCPVCSPTRASIMSGKYPARVGVTQFIGGRNEGKLKDVPYLHYLPLEETSIAAALREGGYQTWHVGKWHLGDADFHPPHHGFDVNIAGFHAGMPPAGYFSPYGMEYLEDGPEGEYLTDRLTDEAIGLIRHRKDKPFFLHLSHYAVHTPIQAPEGLGL
jgi:arylsulfatase A-like enzyme